MYSFPSTSQIRALSPRATKKGSPPTLRNARTGEFTPPGIRFCARGKNSEECEVIDEPLEWWSNGVLERCAQYSIPLLHHSNPPFDADCALTLPLETRIFCVRSIPAG